MKDILIVLVSSLLSGVVATIVLLVWLGHAEKVKRKYEVFAGLMGMRFSLPDEKTVRFMNMVDVVFYGDKDVRKHYKDFLDEANKPENGVRAIDEKHLKLLESMAKSLGYSNIAWDEIKHTYFPVGLAEKYRAENGLASLSSSAIGFAG